MKFEQKTYALPFNPRHFPLFYGWIILVLCSAGMAMSIPGQTMGVSVFTDFLIEALGISRVTLSTAYLIGTLTSALILPLMGRLYDRSGARLLGTIIVIGLGAVTLGFSIIDGLSRGLISLVPWIPAGVVTFAVISIGFFLLRFLGQGVLAMISRNMSMKWFERRRGLANAVMGTIISFSFSFAPRLLNSMIESRGWRGAYRAQGFIVGGAFALIFFLLARDNPAVCGLQPDGKPGKLKREKRSRIPQAARNLTLAETRQKLSFWVYTLALTMFSLYYTGLTFHIVSIFQSSGMDRTTAVGIFFPIAVISVILNFIVSWASDYIRLKWFLIAEVVGLATSMTALLLLGEGYPYILLILGNGIAVGVFGLLSTVTWPRFYGTEHLLYCT